MAGGGVEDQLYGFFQKMPVPTYFYRRVGGQLQLEAYNDAAHRLTRGLVARLVGKAVSAVFDDRPDIPEDMERCLASREVVTREMPYRLRTTGELKYMRVTFAALAADLVVVQTEDLTRPRQLEVALAESERRYEQVVSAMAEGVVIADVEGRTIATNLSAQRILGRSESQVLRGSQPGSSSRVVREDGTRMSRDEYPMFQVLRSGRPLHGVIVGWEHDTRGLVWLSVNVVPVTLPGEPDRLIGVISTFHDITEQKRALEALRASEERYRRIIETTTEGIWSIDLEGKSIFANARMADILGCSREELMEESVWSFLEEDQRLLVRDQLARRARGMADQYEVRLRRKDGTTLWISLATSPVFEGDKVVASLGMVRDISETKRLEEELLQARKLESIGRLAGGVAHDFNNLLTAILMSVKFAEKHTGTRQLEDLAVIRAAAERASTLTRQLLAFARRQVVELQEVSLNEIAGTVARMLRRTLGEDIELVTVFADDLWGVHADPARLEQVLLNLAVNAREAMPSGGRLMIGTANLRLAEGSRTGPRGLRPGDYAVLSVADSGHGMDEETRRRLFEPFFTTKPAGTGLGLASAWGTIGQLGGLIDVTSEPGRGTTFSVYLPGSPAGVRAAGSTTPPPSLRGNETVLVVEDEPLVRRATAAYLETLGYHVLSAGDAGEALALAASSEAIDLVVTDVVMPKLSGPQLAERLLAMRPQLRVLYVSGYSDEVVSRHIHARGGAFLEKPYVPEELAEKIRSVLEETA